MKAITPPWYGCLALLLGALGYAAANLGSVPEFGPFWALVLLGFLLGLAAGRLAKVGLVNVAPACFACLAMVQPDNAFLLAILATGTSIISTGIRPRGSLDLNIKEIILDLLPLHAILLSIVALSEESRPFWFVPLVISLIYLASHRTLASLVSQELEVEWMRAWASVSPVLLLIVLASASLSALFTQAQGLFYALPILGLLQLLAIHACRLSSSPDSQELAAKLKSSTVQSSKLQKQVKSLQARFDRKLDEYRSLETLSQELTLVPNTNRTLDLIVQMAYEQVDCTTVVAYLHEKDNLISKAWKTPNERVLQEAELLGKVEPAVSQTWTSQRVTPHRVEQSDPKRVFPHELSSVGIPIGNLGVLYIGKLKNEGFVKQKIQILTVVASQAALALLTAHRNEQQLLAARSEAQMRQSLQAWAEGANVLLNCAKNISSILSREPLFKELEASMSELSGPCRSLGLLRSEGQLESMFKDKDDFDLKAAELALQTVSDGGKPLLARTDGSTNYQALFQDHECLLCVPITTDNLNLGALYLSAPKAEHLGRKEQNHLEMLALQTAGSLQAVKMHEETLEAYAKLQESESQLIQSGKLAAVGQLAAGVAHELNTPLGTIRLALDTTLRLPNLDERTQKRLNRAQAEVLRAQDITEKLLYYSRDARGGSDRILLKNLVQDTLDLMGHELTSHGVELVKTYSDQAEVVCNENEIQQVVINLLLNARDAIKEQAEPRVELILDTVDERARLRIQDNGAGIDEATAQKIFDPFFTTKPIGQGTGLGLSVSQTIIRGHGGELLYQPAEEGGAVFSICLPLKGIER